MKTVWKLQDAKSRFSRVVKDALTIGPQYRQPRISIGIRWHRMEYKMDALCT